MFVKIVPLILAVPLQSETPPAQAVPKFVSALQLSNRQFVRFRPGTPVTSGGLCIIIPPPFANPDPVETARQLIKFVLRIV